MKLLVFSDLHFEYGRVFTPAIADDIDLVVLAGDIISFGDYSPISQFLSLCTKPVIYITGNHEYYNKKPMSQEEEKFKEWLCDKHPNVYFLRNESVKIGNMNIFGGTMWTDFSNADPMLMLPAQMKSDDYKKIATSEGKLLQAADTTVLHKNFKQKLLSWLDQDMEGPRVVITHHSPVFNPKTKHAGSPFKYAFNSFDMTPIIERYQPDLWIYGHTHECDNQQIGDTKIVSNQRGYSTKNRGFTADGFNENGLIVEIKEHYLSQITNNPRKGKSWVGNVVNRFESDSRTGSIHR